MKKIKETTVQYNKDDNTIRKVSTNYTETVSKSDQPRYHTASTTIYKSSTNMTASKDTSNIVLFCDTVFDDEMKTSSHYKINENNFLLGEAIFDITDGSLEYEANAAIIAGKCLYTDMTCTDYNNVTKTKYTHSAIDGRLLSSYSYTTSKETGSIERESSEVFGYDIDMSFDKNGLKSAYRETSHRRKSTALDTDNNDIFESDYHNYVDYDQNGNIYRCVLRNNNYEHIITCIYNKFGRMTRKHVDTYSIDRANNRSARTNEIIYDISYYRKGHVKRVTESGTYYALSGSKAIASEYIDTMNFKYEHDPDKHILTEKISVNRKTTRYRNRNSRGELELNTITHKTKTMYVNIYDDKLLEDENVLKTRVLNNPRALGVMLNGNFNTLLNEKRIYNTCDARPSYETTERIKRDDLGRIVERITETKNYESLSNNSNLLYVSHTAKDHMKYEYEDGKDIIYHLYKNTEYIKNEDNSVTKSMEEYTEYNSERYYDTKGNIIRIVESVDMSDEPALERDDYYKISVYNELADYHRGIIESHIDFKRPMFCAGDRSVMDYRKEVLR